MTDISSVFNKICGTEPEVTAFAPGRVNLIGEHIDYNGGYVLPCALDMGIYGAARLRNDGSFRFYSENLRDSGVSVLTRPLTMRGSWTDYPAGVIRAFAAMGYFDDRGADFVFSGNLPDGSGLSSSAALEVLTGLLLRGLYGYSVTAQELAVFGQFAENRFIGVNCGIMDQFASAMGRESCAVLLDSATLEYSYAPIPSEEISLVIVNSGVKHSLASSAYNDRRRECESALADINAVRKTPSLCSLTPGELERLKRFVKDPACLKRAEHAVRENDRTIRAAQALKSGDLSSLGRLMRESHLSLRDDYEVSCPELDFLAETAWNTDGCCGARMTGGGFGGCTANLVKNKSLTSFSELIREKYKNKFGRDALVYTARAGAGAHVIGKEAK